MADETDFPTLDPSVARWAALRTSARWEKKIADILTAVGVPVYLPLLQRVTRYQGKRQVSQVPLFPGYVFCSESSFIGNPAVPQGCRAKVAQILRTDDQSRLVGELSHISRILCDHGLVQERIFGQPGETVRIARGPLEGLEGLIIELKPKKKQLLLEVSFLGTRLEVDVNEEWVEK